MNVMVVPMWAPGDHHRHEDHSSVYISPHWVPCKCHVMTCEGSIGRNRVVSRNMRDKFTVACQVCVVPQVWKSHAVVLILDHAVVLWSRAVVLRRAVVVVVFFVVVLGCTVMLGRAVVLSRAALVLSSAIAVGDLEFPPSLHLQDLGSIGSDGGSHEAILHVPVHEFSQGSHFRFRQ